MTSKKETAQHIFIGCLIMFLLGVIFAWSVFVVPLEEALHIERSQTSFIFTLNSFMFSVGSFITGRLTKKLSYRKIICYAGIIICVAFMLLSFATKVWQIYILYGFFVGLGHAMAYLSVVALFPLWMPDKTATATGTLLLGYALSTTFFSPVLNALIHASGIAVAFRMLSVVCGGGIIALSCLVKVPNRGPVKAAASASIGKDYTTPEMLRTPTFWFFYVLAAFVPAAGLSIINHNSPILTETFMTTAAFAALMVSITGISNGIGRFVFGFVLDKIGTRKALMIIGAGEIIAASLIVTGICTKIQILYIAGSLVMLLSYGCNATALPAIMRYVFGQKYFSSNYSILCLGNLIAAFGPSLIGFLQLQSGSYVLPSFVLCGFAALIVADIALFLQSMKKL